MKKIFLAISLALSGFSCHAADYYIVTPFHKPVDPSNTHTSSIKVALNSYALPEGMVNVPYTGFDLNSLLAVTGDSTYAGAGASWRVTAGALPTGISLNPATGILSGTPSMAGSYNFTVRATYLGANGEQTYDITVSNLVVSLATATLPFATPGTSFSYNFKPLLTVTGDAGYADTLPTWSVSSGTLPTGLTLSSGQVSGTPELFPDEGQSFTLKAAYRSKSAQQSYTLYPADPYWSNVSFATHADGSDGSTTIPAAKGAITTSGNLSLSATTAISGTTSIKGTGGKLRVGPDASVSLGTSDFTIEFWAYPLSQTSTAPQLVTNYNASEGWGPNTWGILPTHPTWPNRWGIYVYNATTSAPFMLGVNSLVLNTWTHVAVTRKGSTFRLFLNGNLSSSGTFTGSMDGGQTRGMNFFNDGLNANPFQGYLDEVRVTKGVARYTSNFTPTHISFPTR